MVADRDTTFRVASFFLFLLVCTWRSATRCRHSYRTLTIPPKILNNFFLRHPTFHLHRW